MADPSGILIHIDIDTSKKQLDQDMIKLQQWFNQNHKLNIDLALTPDAIKGLEKLGQQFSFSDNSAKKMNATIQNVNHTISELGEKTKEVFKLDGHGSFLGLTAEYKKQSEQLAEITKLTYQAEQETGRLVKTREQITKDFTKKDSHGFLYDEYEIFTKLSPSIRNATQQQEYWNKSILEGYKLIKPTIQETENYIKVQQQLRQGSQHLDIGVYIDKATGQMYKFSESLRDGMVRTFGIGEAMKTAFMKSIS